MQLLYFYVSETERNNCFNLPTGEKTPLEYLIPMCHSFSLTILLFSTCQSLNDG